MTERDVLDQTRLLLAQEVKEGVFWRNSTGMTDMVGIRKEDLLKWAAMAPPQLGTLIRAAVGRAHAMRFGLAKGSSDLIGCVDGRFGALEAKFGKGKLRPEQALFLDLVKAKGGFGGTFWSPEEALEIVRNR